MKLMKILVVPLFILLFGLFLIYQRGGKIDLKFCSMTIPGLPGSENTGVEKVKKEVEAKNLSLNEIDTVISKASDSIVKQKLESNLIRNGDFNIPLALSLSNWGAGLYSDKYLRHLSGRVVWLNFLNADTYIEVKNTPMGNALKITHASPTQNHSVGVMEQYIDAIPGRYKLSFKAKAMSDFEAGSIQIFTTDNWRIYEEDGTQRGVEITEKGPFDWKIISEEIQIDNPGKRTFSIVSAKRGTVWLTDLSLIKIN